MNIDSLVRPNIRNLKPYTCARMLYQTGTFFDANENAYGSTIELPGYAELNRYPDPYSRELRNALAEYVDVEPKNIYAGNGSDEIIDLLIRIFLNPGENIAVLEPTYGMYRVAAETAGVDVVACRLDKKFQIDLPALWKIVTPKTKMIFLCSPNNPTGNLMRLEDVREICSKFNGIVVVDEAYIEFASKPSLTEETENIENLMVVRTLSKAWGLAGIRVGYAIANERVIEYLDKVKEPYNINRISSALAVKALKNKNMMEKLRNIALVERKKMEKAYSDLGFEVFPTEANFILVKFKDSSRIAKDIAKEDELIIRDFGNRPGVEDCVRITVDTPERNAAVLAALKKRL